MTLHDERPGLGRLYATDHRDLNFMLAAHPLAQSAVQVVSHMWTCRYRINQARTGTCVGHGWKNKLLAAPLQQGTPEAPPTAMGIYDLAILVDEWADNDHDTARQMGTSVRAGAKVLQTLGYISEYRWVYNAEDAARWVGGINASAHPVGGPLVIGTQWRSSMWATDPEGFLRWEYNSTDEGGHCTCILGYDKPQGFFWGVQSWPLPWGYQGRGLFKLDGETMDRLLREGGEACAATEKWVR